MPELTEQVLVAAEAETVWQDWADATSLAQWMWPPRFESPAAVTPAVGGAWNVRSAVTGMAVVGEVIAVDPPRELRIAWRWAGEDQTTDVTVSLEPVSDHATRVTVRHTGFRNDAERDDHIQGWTDCLGRLIQRHA